MTKSSLSSRRPWHLAGFAVVLGWLGVPLLSSAAPSPSVAPAPAAAPRAAQGPERTLAQFGDWSVTCLAQPGQAGRACEMAMGVQNPTRQLAAAIAIGRMGKDAPLRLVVQVPVNTRVAQPLQLTVDGADPLSVPFRSCNGMGCFAELELPDDAVLRRLRARAAEQPSQLAWKDAAGNEAVLPVSFRGFAAASEALRREGG